MKKQITTIAMGILLLSCISAIEMKAGTCDIIDFPNIRNVEVEFTKNSSSMEGFSWNKSGTLITYCIGLNYHPDNFTVRWFNDEEVYVDNRQQRGGGSSYTKKKAIVENETIVFNATSNDDSNITDVTIIIDDKEEPIPESDDGWKLFLWWIIAVGSLGLIWFLFKPKKEVEN